MINKYMSNVEQYMKTHRQNKIWRRILCILLTITTILTGLVMIRPASTLEGTGSGATKGVTRSADPSTMDTYLSKLNFDENTRYAGRLWSDKTVFAYGNDYDANGRTFKGNTLNLTDGLDGAKGTVSLDADFLHVYSALGSSVKVNEEVKNPMDVIFLLDMSGSMATDVETHASGYRHTNITERLSHSRIQKVLKSIDDSIQMLMEMNETNQVSVVAYGAISYTLMPLGHYTKIGGRDYLSVSNLTAYGGGAFGGSSGINSTGSGAYTVTAYAERTDKDGTNKETINRNVRNDYSKNSNVTGNPIMIGYHTDLQAGIYTGFDELYSHMNGVSDVTYTYNSKITGKQSVIPRIPVAFVMTDGASNYALKANDTNPPKGNEWYNLPIVDSITSNKWNGYISNFKKYRNESNDHGGAGVILDILLTASYMKSKVLNRYTDLINKSSVDSEYKSSTHFYINSISVDTPDTNWQIPRVYAALDPKTYFNEAPPELPNDMAWKQKEDVTDAYQDWLNWQKSSSGITVTLWDNDKNNIQIPFNKLPADGYAGVKNEDVIKNILYNDDFHDIGTGDLLGIFEDFFAKINQPMFSPVKGSNDLGVKDSVIYMDPIGKYMEIKDVKNLLLFGKLYSIVPSAVYDYQFNHAWMQEYDPENANVEAFKEGWYYGEDPLDERNAGGPAKEISNSYGSYPDVDGIKSAKEAWDAGWKYYLSYKTAQQYVPTLSDTSSPDEVIHKQQMTTYTFYRLDMTQSERTELHLNPAYQKTIDVEYDPNGKHLESSGVYSLNDIRIWVENSGDYNDELLENSGGIKSDANFDEALWINVPINMMPLRTVTLTKSEDGWNYESNLSPESAGYKASFPMRVFYTVGISDDLLTTSHEINIASGVNQEYIKQNKITTQAAAEARGLAQNSVEFFSNWYNPTKRYNEYVTTKNDYTYGDPFVSFSPSTDNRYYQFEKSLPLYNAVYCWTDGMWQSVKIQEDLTESDGRTFDPLTFDGKLIAQDLNSSPPVQGDGIQSDIWNELHGKQIYKTEEEKSGAGGSGYVVHEGDVILLKSNQVSNATQSDPDPFASQNYFYIPIEYFDLSSGRAEDYSGSAEKVQHVVARKSSEFGIDGTLSSVSSSNMLCWYDVSGRYTQVYPFLNADDTGDKTRGKQYIGVKLDKDGNYAEMNDKGVPTDKPDADIINNGEWIVATKSGGLRVGDLAQAVDTKAADPSDKGTKYPDDYIKERFPDSADLDWKYYGGNITRTSNNYSLPTISSDSNNSTSGVIINVYLGNNGRLSVEDTTLMATKQVILDDSLNFMENSSKPFNYQVFVEGWTNNHDAIVLRYNKAIDSWQRQYHYIDLELNSKMFLQSIDGTLAQVSLDGTRVTGNTDSGYTYAETKNGHNAGETYNNGADGGPYFVYIGTNTNSVEDINAPATGFRVYHNQLVHGGSVSKEEVVVKYYDSEGNELPDSQNENYTGKRVFYAEKVWLVSQEQYDKEEWNNLTGNLDKSHKDELYTDTLNEFELLTLDPMMTDNTENTVISSYLTSSMFWTKTLFFGYKAGASLTESGTIDGMPLEPADLYDQSGSGGDKSVFVGSDGKDYTPEYLAEHTAEVTMTNGYGLLLSSIPQGTDYRFTEKMMDYEIDSGYALNHVNHDTEEGSRTTYSRDGSIWEAYQTGSGGEREYLYKDGKQIGAGSVTALNKFNTGDYTYSVFGESSSYEEAVHYFNEFAPVQMTVSKSLIADEGAEIKAVDYNKVFDFTISLSYSSGTPIGGFYWFRTYNSKSGEFIGEEEKQFDSKGSAQFQLKGDQYVTIYGLPVGAKYTYTVSEADKLGWSPEITIAGTLQPDTKGSYSGSIIYDGNMITGNELHFSNVKQPPVLEPASLKAKKVVETVDGASYTLKDGDFSFAIIPFEDNPEDDPIEPGTVVTNKADGTITLFDEEYFKTDEGVYRYTVKELYTKLIPGITYDETEYTVTVTVKEKQDEDGYTGFLTPVITITKGDPAHEVDAAEFVFTNTYKEAAYGNLAVTKTVYGSRGADGTLFNFAVKFTGTEFDKPLSAVKTQSNGAVESFDAALTKADDGSYTYEFSLLEGQTITFTNIPAGTVYTVSENLEGLDGKYYLKDSVGTDGNIVKNTLSEAEFENAPYIEIPELGGIGTAPFYISGGLLIAAAGAFIVISIRKKRKNQA